LLERGNSQCYVGFMDGVETATQEPDSLQIHSRGTRYCANAASGVPGSGDQL
jgi:hypothetical protein